MPSCVPPPIYWPFGPPPIWPDYPPPYCWPPSEGLSPISPPGNLELISSFEKPDILSPLLTYPSPSSLLPLPPPPLPG